jgi:hypothetical protein
LRSRRAVSNAAENAAKSKTGKTVMIGKLSGTDAPRN